MALIQISDPDNSIVAKREFSVGIDLGTTNSLIAESVDKKITFFQQDNSSLIPSVVYKSNNKLLVGKSTNKESIKSIKRLIGLTSAESSAINFNNLNIDLSDSLPLVNIGDQKLSAIEHLFNHFISFI